MSACGPDASRCVEYCLARGSGPVDLATLTSNPTVTQEDWCATIIHSLGFDQKVVGEVLEHVEWSFPQAWSFLLNRNGKARVSYRFRRHTMQKKVLHIDLTKAAAASVREEYEQRAQQEFHKHFIVVDFGQHAASTIGACFWLCLAAGLSRSAWQPGAHTLLSSADTLQLLRGVRAMPLIALDGAPPSRIEHTALGRLAYKLRKHMCAGSASVLMRMLLSPASIPAVLHERQLCTTIGFRSWPQRSMLMNWSFWLALWN